MIVLISDIWIFWRSLKQPKCFFYKGMLRNSITTKDTLGFCPNMAQNVYFQWPITLCVLYSFIKYIYLWCIRSNIPFWKEYLWVFRLEFERISHGLWTIRTLSHHEPFKSENKVHKHYYREFIISFDVLS